MENPLYLTEVPIYETAKGIKYKKYREKLDDLLNGMDSESQKRAAKANTDFIRGLSDPKYRHRDSYRSDLEKSITATAVHVDRVLGALSVMYKNDAYIGEQLVPPVMVNGRSGIYYEFPKRERLAYPDDTIGHRASSNELDASRTTANYSVVDRGFKNFLDLEAVANQDAPLNEMVDLVEHINDGIAFKREQRLITLVTTAGNYAGNTAGAGTVWDDSSGGTIIADMLGARSSLWMGGQPTRKLGFTTIDVWNTGIAQNPALLDLFKHTQPGLITKAVAGQFRLDDILISESREDTANEGQSASYARMMTSKVFGMVSVATRPTIRSAHFASTFRMQGDPFTTEWTDPDPGKRGGIWARVAVSEDYKVVAGDTGFLITAAIS